MVTSKGSEDTRKYDCDYGKYEIDSDTKQNPQHE
jgi:hypothetical protein